MGVEYLNKGKNKAKRKKLWRRRDRIEKKN